MPAKPAQPDKPRITNQYRRLPIGRVCEIDYFGTRLTVHVWDQEPPEPRWRVEVCTGSGEDAVVIGGCAGTRAEALRHLVEAWVAERRRPSFDWESITALLASVRVV